MPDFRVFSAFCVLARKSLTICERPAFLAISSPDSVIEAAAMPGG